MKTYDELLEILMKTYDELTEEQKSAAVNHEYIQLIKLVVEGGLRFNDELNGDDLQHRIDRACEKAEKMQTPWFVHEYINDDQAVRESLMGIAETQAKEAYYLERGEYHTYISELEKNHVRS